MSAQIPELEIHSYVLLFPTSFGTFVNWYVAFLCNPLLYFVLFCFVLFCFVLRCFVLRVEYRVLCIPHKFLPLPIFHLAAPISRVIYSLLKLLLHCDIYCTTSTSCCYWVALYLTHHYLSVEAFMSSTPHSLNNTFVTLLELMSTISSSNVRTISGTDSSALWPKRF